MREIKYRQAIIIDGKFRNWHYWGLIDGAFVGVDTGICSPTTAIERSYQFTELHDKNGVEIYEGDVLLVVEGHKEGCDCEHCFPFIIGEKLKVITLEDRWALSPAAYKPQEFICDWCSAAWQGLMSPNHEIDIGCYTEVISSIHANPELLEN